MGNKWSQDGRPSDIVCRCCSVVGLYVNLGIPYALSGQLDCQSTVAVVQWWVGIVELLQAHGAPARPMVPLLGRWCPWQACGAPARPLVPLGPDRSVVPLTSLKCPQQARGAPDRPKVPLRGRWCPWQACSASGRPVVPLLGLWCP